MMTLRGIQVKIKAKDYRFSGHAVKKMIERSIDRLEVEEVILDGEVIEECPDDKYSSSRLIFGKTKRGRPIHVQVSLPPRVVIVTTYEPDPNESGLTIKSGGNKCAVCFLRWENGKTNEENIILAERKY